jgi:hypothetical protein
VEIKVGGVFGMSNLDKGDGTVDLLEVSAGPDGRLQRWSAPIAQCNSAAVATSYRSPRSSTCSAAPDRRRSVGLEQRVPLYLPKITSVLVSERA